jgi:hypothetical protein
VIVARAADGEGASEVHFGRLEQPLEVLSSLLALARSAQRAALPFVHDVSRSYAEQLRPEAKASREQALRVAEKLFDDPHGYADAYAKLIYPDFAALNRDGGDAGFTRLAEAVFTPFFRARTLITPAAPDQAAG